MSSNARESATAPVEQAISRVREINDRIVDAARRSGEASLEAYERLLRSVADAQEAAGESGADWIRAFASAEARFTRELAEALPAAARSAFERARGLADTAVDQARRVPGFESAEGEVRGAAAREQDLPIARYDQLTVSEIVSRLEGLSKPDLHKIDAYERKHGNRKTVHEKIETLTNR